MHVSAVYMLIISLTNEQCNLICHIALCVFAMHSVTLVTPPICMTDTIAQMYEYNLIKAEPWSLQLPSYNQLRTVNYLQFLFFFLLKRQRLISFLILLQKLWELRLENN